MQDQEAEEIFERYQAGTASPEERAFVETWYLKRVPAKADFSDRNLIADQKESLNTLLQTIGRKNRVLWPRIAASIVIAISAGLYFYLYTSKEKQTQGTVYANDVAPGKIGATLTLANGKKIKLSDASNGELAKEAGLTISKTADGQVIYSTTTNDASENKINTLSTAKGETYILTLSDKTQVWLNAASSLTYSTTLNERGQRRVKLSGEAYFQVSKDKAHPFIVETDKQTVEVLGTHFNINSYADEQTVKTTLLEGSVRVTENRSKAERILKPSQQVVLDNGRLTIGNVEAQDVIAWKNGLFVFEDEPLESVMKKIARWYDVEIIYQGADRHTRIGGGVSRYENVSKVLKQLELTKGVHFKIEGRKIIAEK